MKYFLGIFIFLHAFFVPCTVMPADRDDMSGVRPPVLASRRSNRVLVDEVSEEFGKDRAASLDRADQINLFVTYAWEAENPLQDYCVSLARDIKRFGATTRTAIEDNQVGSIDAFFQRHVSQEALSAPNNFVMLVFSKMLLRKYGGEVPSTEPEPIIRSEVDAIGQLFRYEDLKRKILFVLIDGEPCEAMPSKFLGYPRIDMLNGVDKAARETELYIVGLRQILERCLSVMPQKLEGAAAGVTDGGVRPSKKPRMDVDRDISWERIVEQAHIIPNIERLAHFVSRKSPESIDYLYSIWDFFFNQKECMYTLHGPDGYSKRSIASSFGMAAFDHGGYDIIWKVSLEDYRGQRLEKAYIPLLKRMGVALKTGYQPFACLSEVVQKKSKRALFIFENVSRIDFGIISGCIPRCPQVQMLFTSSAALPGTRYLDVEPFRHEEAQEYLRAINNEESQPEMEGLMAAAEKVDYVPAKISGFDLGQKNRLVPATVSSGSWHNSNARIGELQDMIPMLTPEDAVVLRQARIDNIEVQGAFAAAGFFEAPDLQFPPA